MASKKFIVIYDTYCGWCYGAGPIFDALVASGAEVEPLHRHLFRGGLAYRLRDGKGAMILKADTQIAALTGRTFSQEYIDNLVMSDTEVLASHYTAQAATLVHDQGAAKEFALRERLETARYVDGVSAANRDAVVAALIAEGISAKQAARIGTPELAAEADAIARRATDLMAAVGSTGVPTILDVTDGGMIVVDHTAFYGQPEQIAKRAA